MSLADVHADGLDDSVPGYSIVTATLDDLDELVRLESALFDADAVVHDANVDPAWPSLHARADFERLVEAPDCLVLLAADSASASVGHLVGYVARAAPTRRPVSFAVLRSIFVDAPHRRFGVAGALTSAFVRWGREQGCVQAHVDHFAANEAATRFYDRHGFAPASVSRSRLL